MRDVDPGQNEIPGVIGDQVEMAPAQLRRPTDEAIAGPEVARGRRPHEACDRPALRVHDVFEVFADRPHVAEIVILRQ